MSENNLSDFQIYNLARPLTTIVTQFFDNEEREREFQEWLEKRKGEIYEQ